MIFLKASLCINLLKEALVYDLVYNTVGSFPELIKIPENSSSILYDCIGSCQLSCKIFSRFDKNFIGSFLHLLVSLTRPNKHLYMF